MELTRTRHPNFNRLKLGGCSNALRVGQNRWATEADGVPEPRPEAAQAAAEAAAFLAAGRARYYYTKGCASYRSEAVFDSSYLEKSAQMVCAFDPC